MFHSAHPYLHFLRVWLTLLVLLAAWPAQAVSTTFTDNSDGTVSDSATGLIWDKCSWGQSDNTCATGSASTHTWAAALRVAVTANTANYKGHNDWRLPNRLELESLVKIDAYNPAIDLAFFPPNGLDSLNYWSSTYYKKTDPTGPTVFESAWFFNFYSGASDSGSQSNDKHVRLVRSGQSFDTFGAVAPTVTAISPTSGGLAGGTAVTITGTDLTGATAVTIGGAACSAFAVASATSITCTTPAGTSGAKNVLVTTPAGVGTGSALFTYQASAAYTKIANNGNELADTAVLGSAPTDWACTRDNVSGLVWEVKTTTSGLHNKDTQYTNYDDLTQAEFYFYTNTYNYRQPTQVEIDAANNSIGFINAVNTNTSALCGSRDWKMPSINELVALYPKINANTALFPNTSTYYSWSGTPVAGNETYAWQFDFGSGDSNDTYSKEDFEAIRLVRSGLSLGNFALTLSASGSGSGNITSSIGSSTTSSTTSSGVSSNIANRIVSSINCTSTAGTTSGVCTTSLTEGTSVVLTATPATGSTFTGWSGACAGSLSPCTVLIAALKSVTATFTLGAVAPTVTAISPSSGSTAGGTAVTLTGTNLTGASAVTIGGAACSIFAVASATSITCTTPAGTAGTASVLVTTSGGTNAANTLYTYVTPAPAPTVTAISPTSGSTLGGTAVTLTGTNLTGASAVTIGGAACTVVTVVSTTSITCTTPAGTAGTASVLVTTSGGTNAANTLYTYVPTYALTATASPTAGGTASCAPNPVNSGGSSTCTATPASGYRFSAWNGNCTGATCVLSNVTSAKSVTASFTLIPPSTPDTYALTATANPVAGGSASCTPNPVNSGSSSTCTATPAVGYTFSAWSGDCTGATCVLSNVTSAKSVTASFTLNSYALTATASPTAGGSASCTPNPVNSGSSSTCTATPAAGYTFSAWSGDCTGATCVLSNVTAAKAVTASFTLNSYALTATASPSAGGSASCTPNPVNSGSSSTCSATPAAGYTFSAWSGDCTGATCVLSNVTAAKAVTASFTLNSYALTATASPTAGGSASCTPNPVNSGSSSTCTATPAAGYTFSAWSGDCTGATCVLSNVTAAKAVTASFTLNSYALTATASPSAGGSASCTPNPVNSGSSSTCSATPAAGYTFSAWSGDCTGATCVLSNVTAAKAVTASFTLNTYTVTPSAGANGNLDPATVQTVNYGATASFTVTPATGYGIATATGCNGGLSGNTYTTGPMVANCQVNVTFSASTVNGACGSDNGQSSLTATPSNLCTTGTASLVYGSGPWNWTCAGSNGGSNASCSATASSHSVSASAGTGGSISPASRTVAHNGVTTFTVSPSGGYVISSVNGCGGNLSGTLYTTGAVTANCAVTANFTATNTTTAISSVTPSPSKVGQSVAIFYSVTGPATSSETVTVKDVSDNTLCTGTVSGGTCNAIFSSSGAKTLIASYAGTAQASDSPGTNHLVADSPALATPTLPSGVVGVPYATMLVASGGVPPYAFTSSALPAGFSLSSSGLLSGTASAVAAPTVRITVTDHLAQSAYQDYTLSLVAQLTVATTSLPEGLVNAPYDQTLQAVGGKTPYVWTVMSGTLPSGLTLNTATGQLNGQPANLGSSAAFTVQVQDADARTASQVLSLTTLQPTVVKTNGSTTLSGNLTPSGGGSTCTLDDSQTLVLNIGDNGAPTGAPSNTTLPYGLFKMTVQGCTPGQTQLNVKLVYPAALPPGTQYWKYGKTAATPSDHWYVLPSAVISGNTVNFSITDGGLGDDDLTADGSITDPGAAGSPLLAISGTPGSGQVGSRYSAALTPSNGSGSYNWSIANGGLPNGVALNAGTGGLSGTPTQAGTFNFTVQLVDTSNNASTTRGFAIAMAASYAITANASPIAGGSASCTPNLVTAGGTSTCTATPAAGYTFSAWSGDCSGATCVLNNVTADKAVTATFTQNSYAITASANPNAGGSASCTPNPVNSGGSSTCTATPASGYRFSAWSGDCTGATCVLSNVQAPMNVTALFSTPWIAAVISSGAPPKGTVGTPYRFTITASGTPLISFSASGLPPGLSLDASSGLLSGTPSTAGGYSVTFSASNTPASGSATKDVQVYTMMIEPAFAAEPASIPTLSEWGMILLSGLMALFGFGQMRRRHG